MTTHPLVEAVAREVRLCRLVFLNERDMLCDCPEGRCIINEKKAAIAKSLREEPNDKRS